MKAMSVEQSKDFVAQKSNERMKIQKEIQELNKSRLAYIASHSQGNSDTMLDAAMIKASPMQASGILVPLQLIFPKNI